MKKGIAGKIILVIFLLIIILPVLTLFIWTFTERWAWPNLVPQVFSTRAVDEIFGRRTEMLQLFGSSIFISTVVGILAVVIGLMTARALTLYNFPGKGLFYFFSILPFMVPATVFAMGVQMLFIRMGINNTMWGVILAHLICSLPYAIRLLMDGCEAVGVRLEEQARVLGASPFKAFWKVSVPVLMPVILSSMSMAYIVSFSQYFLTLLIGGGRVKTFTIVMVPYLQGGNRNMASVYSVAFLGVTVLVFGVFEWLAKKWNKGAEGNFYNG